MFCLCNGSKTQPRGDPEPCLQTGFKFVETADDGTVVIHDPSATKSVVISSSKLKLEASSGQKWKVERDGGLMYFKEDGGSRYITTGKKNKLEVAGESSKNGFTWVQDPGSSGHHLVYTTSNNEVKYWSKNNQSWLTLTTNQSAAIDFDLKTSKAKIRVTGTDRHAVVEGDNVGLGTASSAPFWIVKKMGRFLYFCEDVNVNPRYITADGYNLQLKTGHNATGCAFGWQEDGNSQKRFLFQEVDGEKKYWSVNDEEKLFLTPNITDAVGFELTDVIDATTPEQDVSDAVVEYRQ